MESEDLLIWNVDIEQNLREILFNWNETDLIKTFLILEKSITDLAVFNTNPTLTLESLVHSIRSLSVGR